MLFKITIFQKRSFIEANVNLTEINQRHMIFLIRPLSSQLLTLFSQTWISCLSKQFYAIYYLQNSIWHRGQHFLILLQLIIADFSKLWPQLIRIAGLTIISMLFFSISTLRNGTYHLVFHVIIVLMVFCEIFWSFWRHLQYSLFMKLIALSIIIGSGCKDPKYKLEQLYDFIDCPNQEDAQRTQYYFALSLNILHLTFGILRMFMQKRIRFKNQFLQFVHIYLFTHKIYLWIDKQLQVVKTGMYLFTNKHVLSLILTLINIQFNISKALASSQCKTGKLVKVTNCMIQYSDCQSVDLIIIDHCLSKKNINTDELNIESAKLVNNQFYHISNDQCLKSCFQSKFDKLNEDKDLILLPGNRHKVLNWFEQQQTEVQSGWSIPLISPVLQYWKYLTGQLTVIQTIIAYAAIVCAAILLTNMFLFILYKIYLKLLEEQAVRHARQCRSQVQQEQKHGIISTNSL